MATAQRNRKRKTSRYLKDVIAGRIGTDPKPLCPVCRFPTQIRHEKDGSSYCLCPLCSASNRRTLE